MTDKNDPDDDPWEGFVFDEAFVKGGRHEPPARTRESIARYGGERTSWRQGALLEPVPAKRRSRRRGRAWLIAAAVIGVVALGAFLISRGSAAPEIPAATAPPVSPPIADPSATASAVAASTSSDEPGGQTAGASTGPAGPSASVQNESPTTATGMTEVDGVSEFDAVGTCYSDPLTNDGAVYLSTVDCTSAHNLELVSHRTAADDADAFPDDRYWDEVVGAACEDDLTAYLGAPIAAWPAGVDSYWLIPTAEGWAAGDRHIICMFRTDEIITTPVRG